MERLISLGVVVLIAVSCTLGSDHDDASEDETDPVTRVSTTVGSEPTAGSFILSCDNIHTIEYMREGGFQGYATPREAVESWKSESGVPDGGWVQHEGVRWVLVNEDGENVARTEVRTMTGNASTTFATERYASDGIEYCG
jgi:hypothetical protein